MSSTVILLFLLVCERGKWIKLTIKQNSYCRLYPLRVFAYVYCTVRLTWPDRSAQWVWLSQLTDVQIVGCVWVSHVPSYSVLCALTSPPIIRLTIQSNHCRAMPFHISNAQFRCKTRTWSVSHGLTHHGSHLDFPSSFITTGLSYNIISWKLNERWLCRISLFYRFIYVTHGWIQMKFNIGKKVKVNVFLCLTN
jgi:hypothetical protein